MKYLLSMFVAVALVGTVHGQAVPPPIPQGPTVVFPAIPVPAPPVPIPGQAQLLSTDQLYVIQSSAPVVVIASPQGVVKITQDAGPLKIRGKFVDGSTTETRTFKGPNIYIVEATSNGGTCELIVVPSLDAKAVDRRTLTTEAPVPPTPTPPGPTPVPPSPAPIPAEGFRSLIVYESAELSKLPPTQLAAIYSQQVRDYLTAHAAMGPDGKTKEWRCYDKDMDTTNESKLWQDAMKRPRKEVPWILLSNGRSGFEGPLPKTEAELLSLLKQYGGA